MTARSIWFVPQQPESPEAIGFDEYCEKHPTWRDQDKSFWLAAQSALLASGQYIKIPPVEEWPEQAQRICVGYRWDIPDPKSIHEYLELGQEIPELTVERPAPAWKPAIGDFVTNGYTAWVWASINQTYAWIAACDSLEEIKKDKEYFRQRGRFLEVK